MRHIDRDLVAVFLLPLLVFLMTMPLTVALEDDGLFILSSYFNGLSHPPGYPLHSLIGKLFTLVPVGTVAARVHAVSAVFGAASCVMLWLLIKHLLHSRSVAYAGAMGYAFSSVFWSQSIIAEVYTLNTFFFFTLFYLLLLVFKLEQQGSNYIKIRKLVYLSAFIYGLSLCNHWPLMVLSALPLLIISWPTIKREPSTLLKSIPFLIAGLLPYAWMVFNSQTDPFISYLGPIESWQQFYHYVSRGHYASVDTSVSAGMMDKVYFTGFYLRELADQFTLAGLTLMVIGFFAQFRYMSRLVCFALVTGFLFNSIFLILLLGFDYTSLYRSVIRVYFLVSYGIGAIWIASGLYWLLEYVDQYHRYRAAIGIAAAVTLVAIVAVYNYGDNNRHDYTWGEQYARAVLDSVPSGAVLIVDGDISVGTIGYMHYVEGIGKDIKVLASRSLVFNERIFDPWTTVRSELPGLISEYVRNSDRRVFSVSPDQELYKEHYWLTYGHSSDYRGKDVLLHLSALDIDYLEYIVNENVSNDDWTARHRYKLMTSAINFIIERMERGERREVFNDALGEVLGDMDGFLVFVNYIMQRNMLDRFGGMDNILSMAENLYQQCDEKAQQARYMHFRGVLELEAGNADKAKKYFLKSIEHWSSPENASFTMLADIYRGQGEAEKFDELLDGLGSDLFDKFRI